MKIFNNYRNLWLQTTFAILTGLIPACTNEQAEDVFGDPRMYLLGAYRMSVYYTDPGTSEETSVDKKVDQELIKMIDKAEISVDMAVYNLGRDSIINALSKAEERGLAVRMVGDVEEVVTNGYRAILRTNIPFSLGNTTAIQHNKFALIDGTYIFMGTGNITNSGFQRNNNNFMIVESPDLAAHYRQEFEQMYYGRYGSKKIPFSSRTQFMVNFTPLEVYYSPYQGQAAMDRIIGLIDNAKFEVQYMIFAHTHDELSAAMIRAAKRGVRVRGIHDKTFVRGTSEEAPRLYSASIYLPALSIKQDGNEYTAVKGVSAHGGKLHTKTIIIDGQVVCTGSFNWSTNAVKNNDENMVVVHSPIVAQEIQKQWQSIWNIGQPITKILYHNSGQVANYGDIVISEIMWAGSYEGTDFESGDDWIELYNTTDHDIDISHWSLTWDAAESRNYPIPDNFNWYEPGVASRHYDGVLTISAKSYFLLNAANGAIVTTDNKISGTKNFALTESGLRIRLYDLTMNLIDEAGNGDPPLAGSLRADRKIAYSMERFFYPAGHAFEGKALPGASAGSWYTSNGNNLTVANLKGLGQLGATFSQCVDVGGNAANCTVGTPNYSGNISTMVSPSTATGGENSLTNLPTEAFSTGSSSAMVQMRWAMQAAPSISGSPCPCSATVSSSDPSLLNVSTATQTSGSIYTLTVGSAADITTGASISDTVSFTGSGLAQAQMQIDQVYVASSNTVGEDVVVIKALTSGTIKNLGIYFYDYASPVPQLLYRMSDAPIVAGQFIQVALDKSTSDTNEDRILGGSPSISITSGDGSGVVPGLTANSTYEVFSSVSGLTSTDAVIFISYDLSASPMDLMCYSNRDGDVSFSLMDGGYRSVFQLGNGVYNLGGQYPVDGVNDSYIQSFCSSVKNIGSKDYLQRNTDSNNGSDFSLIDA